MNRSCQQQVAQQYYPAQHYQETIFLARFGTIYGIIIAGTVVMSAKNVSFAENRSGSRLAWSLTA
jgi:hypothetical protein